MHTTCLPLDLYKPHLKMIRGVNFTRREVETLAFLTSGRSVKAIASSLRIAIKTVETHTHNIMLKMECNSREGIIDFIERSDKLSLLRNHYAYLLTTLAFEHSLGEIAKLNLKLPLSCLIIFFDKGAALADKLNEHFTKSGFNVYLENREKADFPQKNHPKYPSLDAVIYCLAENTSDFSLISSSLCLFILPDSQSIDKHKVKNTNFIDLSQQENYYLMLFEVLKRLLPALDLSPIMEAFRVEYERLQGVNSSVYFPPQDTQVSKKQERKGFYKEVKAIANTKSAKWIIIFSLLGTVGLLCVKNQNYNLQSLFFLWVENSSPIRSDLILPTDSAFLNRTDLIKEIDSKFKGSEPIRTIALIGIGGSGKTTMARQYAQQQKVKVVWEINAETRESLALSFENLALALSKTDRDKQDFREMQDIKNTSKREEALIQFVKTHLREISDWFLIFDNVEKFPEIQTYFPQDTGTWGKGRVLLTTRDSHLESHPHVKGILLIGELSPEQKFTLFTKIMNNDDYKAFTHEQIEDTKKFLQNIPSFPLDISIAAYYLKATHSSYQDYLEKLGNYDQDFANMQEGLLKETSSYIKTRYNLIKLSVADMVKGRKDFRDLLFFISLLDSQNIPKTLLGTYKGSSVVDSFIYYLKKYSLITNESSVESLEPTLSLHRSTQEMILAYLRNIISTEENKKLMDSFTSLLEDHVEISLEKEELSKLKVLVPHLELFLSHDYLLSDSNRGLLESKLGSIYSSLSLFMLANDFFDKALFNLRKNENRNYNKIAKSLLTQGQSYNILGEYKKAKVTLTEAIYIYKNHLPQDKNGIALGLMYLGNLSRWIGELVEAENFLNQSIALYKSLPEQHLIGEGMALAYLGDVYRRRGIYEKAISMSTESLELFKKHLAPGNVRCAWPIFTLGIIHMELGNYKDSLLWMNQSAKIIINNLSEKSVFVAVIFSKIMELYSLRGEYLQAIEVGNKALKIHNALKSYNMDLDISRTHLLLGLGNAYKGLKNYEKAKNYLEKNLTLNIEYYGDDHIEKAHVLESLGQVYIAEGNLERAQDVLSKALQIYKKNNHPSIYKCLEDFSDLHFKESEKAASQGDLKEAQRFKIQAKNDLIRALDIIEKHFPKNSPHQGRIRSKLKMTQNIS